MSSTDHFSALALDPLSAVCIICINLISLHTFPSTKRRHPIASCALAISISL